MSECNCEITWNKICKGKDLKIDFPVLTDGEESDLSGRDLQVELTDSTGVKYYPEFSTEGNVVSFTFLGIDQTKLGIYSVRLWENKGKVGQCMLDFTHAFELVRTTEDEFFITTDSDE